MIQLSRRLHCSDVSWKCRSSAAFPAGLLCLLIVASASGGGPPPSDPFAPVRVPNPMAEDNPRIPLTPASAPAPGGAVRDDRLGTTQVRVTSRVGLRHEYARHDPFNADGSLVLLTDITSGTWQVFRTTGVPYDREGALVRTIEAEEPRWDATDRAVLWATQDFRILRIDVESGASSTVKDFREDPVVGPVLEKEPDLYRITMKDEGEAWLDRRYWAFIVQGAQDDYRPRYLLVWDRTADAIAGLRNLSVDESRIDWVGMSPKGAWVLIGSDHDNAAPLAGFVMADRALKQFHPLNYSTGHADVGLDAQGNEVVVMQNAHTDCIDMIPLDPSVKAIPPDGSYAGSGHVPLVRLYYASDSPIGFDCGVHISCNFPGWCVVSTHMAPGAEEKNWLDRALLLVRLDAQRPLAYYVAKVYGACSSYWEETHASISADGTRMVWATNWGRDVGNDKVWLMQLTLPRGWERGRGGAP